MERTRHLSGWASMVLLAGALAGCSEASEAEDAHQPAFTLEAVEAGDGGELSRVTLTEDAARRADIQTEAVEDGADGQGLEIPYAAVLYDPEGNTWAFVNVEGLTFVREPITIERIEGDVAYLAEGPPAGTDVVTSGATQLYGAEIGVDH